MFWLFSFAIYSVVRDRQSYRSADSIFEETSEPVNLHSHDLSSLKKSGHKISRLLHQPNNIGCFTVAFIDPTCCAAVVKKRIINLR